MNTDLLLIWGIILLSGLFSLALLNIKTNHFGRIYLLIFTINFSLHFLSIYFFEYSKNGFGINLNPFFASNYGPLLMLYVSSFKKQSNKINNTQLLYFFPSLIFLFVGFSNISKFNNVMIITGIILCINITFLILSFFIFKKNSSIFNTSERKWMFYTLFFFALLILMSTIHLLSSINFPSKFQDLSTTLIFISAVILIFFFIYYSIVKPDVFQSFKKKYLSSNLSTEKSFLLSRKIKLYLETDEKFLDDSISINNLSTLLESTPKNISQAINEHLGNNFYDVLNTYRIEKAILLLKEESNMSIKNIMYDCGFNNKATFNKVFKEKTGLTPSNFKKKAQQE